MPSVSFILPHWLYWSGLLLVPAIAMLVVRREKRRGAPPAISLAIAYMFWLCAGFAGLHRFYLRSRWGWVFIPLLAGVIFANLEVKDARSVMSGTRQILRTANYELDRAQTALRNGVAGAAERLAAAKTKATEAQAGMSRAQTSHDRWSQVAGALGLVIVGLLLVDAALLPRLTRRAIELERTDPIHRFKPVELPPDTHQQGTGEDPTLKIKSKASAALDWVTERAGEFVAYWTLLSIFVYYYEVIVRFLFNSPTNWVHESMFLMYGMQYLIAGAYAYKVDAHVRVDVFYVKLSDRAKAMLDIVTSFFFFLFTLTMLTTGYIYASYAMRLHEVSFSEWGIQYWPIKIAIPVGAFLLLLQGLSKLIKDIQFLATGQATAAKA